MTQYKFPFVEESSAIRQDHWYNKVFHAMSDALVLFEVADGQRLRNVEVNPAFEKITGLQRSSLLGEFIEDAIPNEAAKRLLALCDRCQDSGTSTTDDTILEFPSGCRSLRSTLIPVHDSSGAVRGIIGLSRDNTAQIDAMRKSDLMCFALDHMLEGAFLMNESGRFEYVNAEACRALGYTKDELLSMAVSDIDPNVDAEEWERRWQQRKREGTCILESCHQAKDGQVYPVEIYSSYFECEGKGLLLAMVRDISARKEAEALLRRRELEFRSLAENSPDHIARYDRQCRPIYVNLKLARFLGYDSQEECVQKKTLDPNGPYAEYFATLRQTIESGKTQELEWLIPGTNETHLILFAPEYDAEGQIIGALIIGRDITNFKRSQSVLAKQEAELAANKAAIGAILTHTRQSEDTIRENMQNTLESIVLPLLDQAIQSLSGNETAYATIQLAKEYLQQAASPFAKKLSRSVLRLSPREMQVASLIKQGLSTKEIASRLHLADGTVEIYRVRLRDKLQIKNKNTNLRTYLLSLHEES